MAKEKFFWLRLKRDFFKRHDIQIIEGMENGKDYVLFYLKLLVESVDHEGCLRFSDTIPYNDKMLATVTNTNIDVVRSALTAFTELGMIEVLDDQTIYMREVEKMIGKAETDEHTLESTRERVRRYRERKRLSETAENTDETLQLRYSNVTCNGELEIETDTKINNIYTSLCDAVIAYLNEKAGTHYRSNIEKTRRLIKARADEHFTLEDFQTVIDKKVREWKGTDMEKYLRPETLFGTKFEGYLNATERTSSAVKKNAFTGGYEQREYDMSELEAKLLGRK